MKYREVPEAEWTNYYVKVDFELPMVSNNKILGYYPAGVLILGKPGSVSLIRDLDTFMENISLISFLDIPLLDKDCYRDYPVNFSTDDIINWIIEKRKDNIVLVERLKRRKLS